MFSLICAWINGWVNNGEGGDLRRHRTHYDVIDGGMHDLVRGRLKYAFSVTFVSVSKLIFQSTIEKCILGDVNEGKKCSLQYQTV